MFLAGIHLGPPPEDTQVYPLPHVISGKGPEIYEVSGSFIRTGGVSFSLAWVELLKWRKIGSNGSINELLRKLKTDTALDSLSTAGKASILPFDFSKRSFKDLCVLSIIDFAVEEWGILVT